MFFCPVKQAALSAGHTIVLFVVEISPVLFVVFLLAALLAGFLAGAMGG